MTTMEEKYIEYIEKMANEMLTFQHHAEKYAIYKESLRPPFDGYVTTAREITLYISAKHTQMVLQEELQNIDELPIEDKMKHMSKLRQKIKIAIRREARWVACVPGIVEDATRRQLSLHIIADEFATRYNFEDLLN